MRFSSRRASARGFTLIEMLIVISVIGILAGLLFPVFSRVRNTARTTTCSANLHQIGLALQLYVNDNNHHYPTRDAPFGNADCVWADLLAGYIRSPEVFQCPMTGQEGAYRSGCVDEITDEDKILTWNGSYGLNVLSSSGRLGMMDANMTHPASTLLVLDSITAIGNSGFVGVGSAAQNTSQPAVISESDLRMMGFPIPGRHDERNNVLFADNHVKSLSIPQLAQRSIWIAD